MVLMAALFNFIPASIDLVRLGLCQHNILFATNQVNQMNKIAPFLALSV